MKIAYSVIVIGAGQAGLTMGYVLKSAGIDYIIFGKEERIGDAWRNRYDSLLLFTPRWMSHLPGYKIRNDLNPNGYAGKDEIADEFEAYVKDHQLHVQLETEVIRLSQADLGYIIETNQGSFHAMNVIIATGPFQKPHIPEFSARLSPEIYQVHSAHYKNRKQLKEGNVLIVGCGNSGAQIAVELAQYHPVQISSSGEISFVPQNILGKSLFWWLQKLGLFKVSEDTWIGQRINKRGDPVIGKELKTLLGLGKVKKRPRVINAVDDQIEFKDGTKLKACNVIWATGYTSDYSWINISKVLDEHARPNHDRGISAVKGIYFLGLPWQSNRSSALIGGVAADAEFILKDLIDKQRKAQFSSD